MILYIKIHCVVSMFSNSPSDFSEIRKREKKKEIERQRCKLLNLRRSRDYISEGAPGT